MCTYKILNAKNAAGSALPATELQLTEEGKITLAFLKVGGTNQNNAVHGYLHGQPIKMIDYDEGCLKVSAGGTICMLELQTDPLNLDYRLKSE